MRNDDERLRLYLLGELPEEESDGLEERLLQEDDLSELFDAMEAEVLEALARGELSAEQRKRIEEALAASPRLRSRAALVRGLARVANEDGRGNLLPFPSRIDLSRPAVRFASIAAALLMMVSLTWLAVRLAPHGNGAGAKTEAGEIAETLLTPVPAPPATPAPADTPAPRGPEPGPDRLAERPDLPPAPPRPAAVTAVFQLAAITPRDAGEPAVFEIEPGTERVEIHIALDSGYEKYPPYTAVLRRDGQEILRLPDLEVRQTGQGFAAILPVAREKLPEGHYSLELTGTDRSRPLDVTIKDFEVRG